MSNYRYDKWQKYAQELEELNLSVENFTVCVFFPFFLIFFLILYIKINFNHQFSFPGYNHKCGKKH